MPWFFYKSGLFSSSRKTVSYFKHYAAKYLIPFAAFGIFGCLERCIFDYFFEHKSIYASIKQVVYYLFYGGTIYGNEALWFLLSLFVVRCLSDVPIINNHRMLSTVISGIFAFTHCILSTRYRIPYWVGNICLGFVFYNIGKMMSENKRFDKERWPIILSAIAITLIGLCHLGGIIEYPSLFFHHNEINHSSYLLYIITSICSILLFSALFRYKISLNIHSKVLSYICNNSMVFYGTHWIVIDLVNSIISHINPEISGLSLFSCDLLGCVIILPIISRIKTHFQKQNRMWRTTE